ncbi:MAG: C25 family cysteine peptidase [Polyangiaceae bacterium]|nr:C25 family cysteine peptidase [Polyangiaceae bacterium]
MPPTQALRAVCSTILGCLLLLWAGTAEAAFGYRQSITVDRTKVGLAGTTTITDFAVFVSFTDTDLRVTGSGGDVTSSSGHDIVFRANDTTTCGGPASCTLSHELISYTSTTGKIVAFVRLPSVNAYSAASNTVFYIYYGDSSITSSTQRKTDVWKDYAAVWHLEEAPNGTAPQMDDSTSNARDGTTSGSMTAAQSVTSQVTKGLLMDGDDGVSTADFLSGVSAFSAEGWILNTDDGLAFQTLVGKSSTNTVSSTNYVFALGHVPDPSPEPPAYVQTVVATGGVAGTAQKCYDASIFSEWSHIAFSYDGANVIVYINGAAPGGSGCTYAKTGTLNTTTTPVTLGRLTSTGTSYLAATMDEVRLSTVARSASYFKAVYNNQNSPSTFYTVGAEDAVTVGEFAVDFLGAHAIALPNGQVLLGWQTGLERDNLGFHVVREQGGVFSQVTQDLVGGSLLRAMLDGNGGSPYFWLDHHGWGAGPVRYFVEDVDAYGKATRHGPFAPAPPSDADAGLLSAWSAQQEDKLGGENHAKAQALVAESDFAEVARSLEFTPESLPALIKVGVSKNGWQRVTGAALALEGFPLGVASNRVAVLKDGAELARSIEDGADGTFDAEDTLEFWGLGEPGIYANEGVYLVSWEGPRGRDVLTSGAAPPAMSALGPSGFPTSSEYAEKKFYLAALNNGPGDNFMGPLIRPSGLTVPVPTPDPLGAVVPRLQVNLQGTSLLPHQVDVAWDGIHLGSVSFANREQATFESALPEIYSDNTLTLTGTAGDYDYSAIVNARVFYQRAYRALNGQLRFTALGGDNVSLSGFAQPGIRVLDLTNSAVPTELSVLEFGPPDDLSGKVAIPGSGTRDLFAFTEDAVTPPASLKRYQSSALRAAGPADLVILSHGSFLERLGPLVRLRESEGLRVVVDDVEAIYDEFGRGRKDPEAIRESLRWLAAQGRPAKYLLLVGDGSFDPHNYLGKNVADFVPVPTLNTPAFETAYDDYYADLNEDGRPELAVGRLPVRTPEELGIVIEKLVRYSVAPPDWPLDVLLVAGEDALIDVAKIGQDALQGEPLSVREQALTPMTPKQELLGSLTEPSSRLVTYIGHGSTQVWGNGSAFATSDAVSLSRTGPPSVFTLLTCLNGFFHDVYGESLAEGLLRAPHGVAVSVWAPPAMAQSDDLGLLYQTFISEWSSGRIRTLGELVVAVKRQVAPSDTERMMALLGDPSLRLALPQVAQTRAAALAPANDPPPGVLVPPPVPTSSEPPSPAPSSTSTRRPVRGLFSATPEWELPGSRMIYPSSTEHVATLPGGNSDPPSSPAAVNERAKQDVGPERTACALPSGPSSGGNLGFMLLLLTAGMGLARSRERRRCARYRKARAVQNG